MDAYETTIYTAVLITGFVVTCIIIYFAISIFRHQRRYIQMQRQYFLDEINLLEKERTRIARDLHDELAPVLSVTKFQISGTRTSDEAERIKISKASDNLDNVMMRLGEIAANLSASLLMRKGLHFALNDFFEDLSQIHSLKIEFIYQLKDEVPADRVIHIYRMLQEIAHNAVKHSGATLLRIELKERKGKIYISCEDNGKGFNQEKALMEKEGIGLKSIESRTGMLGGKVKLNSSPQKGTCYFFELPKI